MQRTTRFLLALVVGLGGLALLGYSVLTRTTRRWFETDVAQRAQLAVASAQRGLVSRWGDAARVSGTLHDITRDDRIMGGAACSQEAELLAQTDTYPDVFSCRWVLDQMRLEAAGASSWFTTEALPTGQVHLSAVPIFDGESPLGVIVLLHDLSYVERREATTRDLLLAAFFVLALGGSLLTIGVARLAWRRWTVALQRSLAGEPAGEFLPLLRDVRSLAEQLATELSQEAHGGVWSPARLRSTLMQYLQGERVVILANREPYIHEKGPNGITVQHPASGLVSALEPVMRACSGVWVAHGSGSADRETVDANDRVRVPPGEESYLIRRVWLSEAEENGYYYGFSNEGLWPLCHVAHTRPTFRAEDWAHYVSVNRKFAEAVCREVDSDDPIVLIQDYHFALAPQMIREKLPNATIIMFWHIPWPNAERFGICPWREELLSGLLGSSVVGFHTRQHCNNFIDAIDAFMESRIDRETNAVVQGARRTLVRPYPISIEWPVRWLGQVPPAELVRIEVRKELGIAPNALLGVGIDRLDYTKGIEERLSAVGELLARYPEFRGRFHFAQLAAPSRTKIDQYRQLNERVEALAAEINQRWGTENYRPILLLRAHHEPLTVFCYYRAAELCYVSSLHDGMNLVAKEFVAARDDERGVLLLSQFTGAARELTEALIVNPYDLHQASDALATALRMSPEEQRDRMRSMRRLVSSNNVYRWAGRMLVDAAEIRRRERLLGRFGAARREGV